MLRVLNVVAGAALFGSTAALVFAATPKLTFTKSFPGSVPAYECVVVDRSGALRYSEAASDDHPLMAQLEPTDAEALFAMAQKLDFGQPIESGLKVANTGKKTFRFEDQSGTPREVTFNYSTLPAAQQLLDRFEQIAESERAYIQLERAVRYDKLGVNDALAQIESLWLRKQLAAPQQFVPLLTRVSTKDVFMHLARERAARLKDAFTALPQAAASDQKTK